MAQMQWFRWRSSSRIQVERFSFFFQFQNRMEITMRKEYAATYKMVHRLPAHFLKTLDYCIIHLWTAESFCKIWIDQSKYSMIYCSQCRWLKCNGFLLTYQFVIVNAGVRFTFHIPRIDKVVILFCGIQRECLNSCFGNWVLNCIRHFRLEFYQLNEQCRSAEMNSTFTRFSKAVDTTKPIAVTPADDVHKCQWEPKCHLCSHAISNCFDNI